MVFAAYPIAIIQDMALDDLRIVDGQCDQSTGRALIQVETCKGSLTPLVTRMHSH